jgi:hypothetical protein
MDTRGKSRLRGREKVFRRARIDFSSIHLVKGSLEIFSMDENIADFPPK